MFACILLFAALTTVAADAAAAAAAGHACSEDAHQAVVQALQVYVSPLLEVLNLLTTFVVFGLACASEVFLCAWNVLG